MKGMEIKTPEQKTPNGNAPTPHSRVIKKEDSEFQSYTYIKNELNTKNRSLPNILENP